MLSVLLYRNLAGVANLISSVVSELFLLVNLNGMDTTHPTIITLFDELKGKRVLSIHLTNPDFRIHQQTVMEVDDWLLAIWLAI